MIAIKKFNFEKKYLIPAVYALFVICAAIAFEKTIGNIHPLMAAANGFFSTLLTILKPFVYGLFIAYFMNPAMSRIDQDVLGRLAVFRARPQLSRILSAVMTYIILIGGVFWIIAYLLPELVESIRVLIVSTPERAAVLERIWVDYFTDSKAIMSLLDTVNATIHTDYKLSDIIDMVMKPVMTAVGYMPTFINNMVTQTISAAYGILNFIIGMIVAFYMLCDKEKFSHILTKLLFSLFRKPTAEKIIDVAKSSNTMFKSFFMGKALDSTIIGIIFFVVALVMKLHYPVLLSLIIGVTNMIPYFGPFIGAIPVIIIVLLTNYKMAIWTALAILVIQQFDGNVLGPKILGDSTGLSPIGVIFSITIGGALSGPLGMFLGVPVFAVISNITLALLDKKYNQKMNKGEG